MSEEQSTDDSLSPSLSSLYILLCRLQIPGWKNFPSEAFRCSPLVGGLSNQLFHIQFINPPAKEDRKSSSSPSNPPNSIVLRLYGDCQNSSIFPLLQGDDDEAKEKKIQEKLDELNSHDQNTISSSPSSSEDDEFHLFPRCVEIFFSTEFSSYGIGPRIYSSIPSYGRFEQFLPGNTLWMEHLHHPVISSLISIELSRFHCLGREILGKQGIFRPFTGNSKFFYQRWALWYEKAEKIKFPADESGKPRKHQEILKSLNFSQEFPVLQALLEEFSSPLVFCHGDLQEGNIIMENGQQYQQQWNTMVDHEDNDNEDSQIEEELWKSFGNSSSSSSGPAPSQEARRPQLAHIFTTENPIKFIDFEYSHWYPRGFDLGNHYCEHYINYRLPCSQPPFFSIREENIPSERHWKSFLRYYIHYYREYQIIYHEKYPSQEGEAKEREKSKEFFPSHFSDEELIEYLYEETLTFSLASHFQWSIWSILLADRNPQVSFDYLEYAHQRMEYYYKGKILLEERRKKNRKEKQQQGQGNE